MTERSGATASGSTASEGTNASGAGTGAAAPAVVGAPPAVVATAGHVDHGKSSLVMRLTGTDPDRLDEEKRRGLTIELGYAWSTLPSGRELGFVDVPGHERFVRTMLAGVGPVRLVLFVVAADEGWKPQSEEHLEIVDVLGVHGAVIALTKLDLVDRDGLARARTDVAERVAGTALENARVVACSSTTGEGFDDLVAALDEMLARAPEPERDRRPRLFVDRVFSIKGTGTVVTGTLSGGPVAIGEDVEVLPSGARARIRGLQTHHRRVEVARPVSRVAASLSVDRARIARGEVLSHPGAWLATDVLEARIEPVRSLDRGSHVTGGVQAARGRGRARRADPPLRRPAGSAGRCVRADRARRTPGPRCRRSLRPARIGATRDRRRRRRPRRGAAAPRGTRTHAPARRPGSGIARTAPLTPGRRTAGHPGRRSPIHPRDDARGRGRRRAPRRMVARSGPARRDRIGGPGSARHVPRRRARRGRRRRRDRPSMDRGPARLGRRSAGCGRRRRRHRTARRGGRARARGSLRAAGIPSVRCG